MTIIMVDGWLDLIDAAEERGFDPGWAEEDGSFAWHDGVEDAARAFLQERGITPIESEGTAV